MRRQHCSVGADDGCPEPGEPGCLNLSLPNFHDRYVFVDRGACYQSGASFKDGAKKAPTTLTQITDAFGPMLKTYEDLWGGARVER